MPITAQQKLEILQQVGADPDKYWLDDEGNVIDLPKDNSAMAGVKTALLNLPRTAAGIGGAALGTAGAGALGLPSGPGAVATGIAGGFAGAAAGSTLGEKFQNAIYPDDVRLAQEARQVRNPVATQVGDLAAQAVFMRPSLSQTRDAIRGVRALTTLPKFSNLRPSQASALMNMALGGTIEGASTLAQGGDAGEIAKNAAIGAVFSNPTWLAGKMTRGVFSPHVPDMGLRDVVNPADLRAQPGEPVAEKPAEVNPELLKAFAKQQRADAKLAEQLAALKANQEAAAKKSDVELAMGQVPAEDPSVIPQNLESLESRLRRSQAVEPDVEVALDPQAPKPQPKPPVIAEPGTPGALDQELGIRMTKPFFDWWAKNANENYRTRMNLGRLTGEQGQSVAGVTEGTRGLDGQRNITVDKQAYTDTAPHELTHGMILDVLQHGKKGEQAEMRRLLKLAGVDEEAFVQGVGEDVVRRFMDKTDDSWRSDFVSFMKYKFGKATPEDARRIMSNTMLRGGGPKTLPKVAVKPTQQVEEKPPVIPPPKAEPDIPATEPQSVEGYEPNMGEFKPDYAAQEPEVKALEEMNRQNAGKVENVQAPPVERSNDSIVDIAERLVRSKGKASTALLQRQLRLGYKQAVDVMAELERRGVVGPAIDAEPRRILDSRAIEAAPVEQSVEPQVSAPIETTVETQDLAQPRSAELANLPQPNRPVGSARRGAERVAAKEFSKLKKEVRNIDPADLSDVGRPEARTYSGESIPANVRRGRVVSENARESAADLEARRIEARLAGEERPRYQEFGEDRTFATDFEKELAKSAPFKIQASKDGRLNRNDIKAAVAKLNPTEQEMLKEAGLEQYLTKVARPTKEELMSWAEENIPRVEVKELSAEGPFSSEAENEMAVLAHELDTLKPGWADLLDTDGLPEHIATKIERYRELNKIRRADVAVYLNDSATRLYDDANINPRQLADMPGAVDLLVRLPRRKRDMNDSRNWDSPNPSEEEAPLYSSNHYPESGDNLLAHVRAYEHTMPDGEKVLRVFELQSDWAQERRKLESSWVVEQYPNSDKFGVRNTQHNIWRRVRGTNTEAKYATKAEADAARLQIIEESDAIPEHPLLAHHQRLALKAAIEHARNRGIKKVVVDDAETAMMTEGHDRAAAADLIEQARTLVRRGLANNVTDALNELKQTPIAISQERGMRLAYDNVLQQMMRDLSGDGVKVEMGEHRNAFDQVERTEMQPGHGMGFGSRREAEAFVRENPGYEFRVRSSPLYGDIFEAVRTIPKPTREDLIFRNPDGTPKTKSTGYAYDVSATQARRDAGEPFSYAGRRYQQFGPNRPTSGLADPAGRRDMSPFESASQKAARSDNPVIRTVGRALTELFPAQRAMRGKYRALPEAFADLNEKDKDLLYKILIDEYRAGTPAPGTVPARLRKEYNDVRRTLRQMRDDQIKAGQRNADGAIPGIDDSYFPNVVDPSVRKTIADEIDSPRFKQLKDEFVKFNEQHLRSRGYNAADASKTANKFFNRFIGTLNKQPVKGAFDFGAVVLPEGSRLPDNWLHSDPAKAMSQYVRDWSRSRTFHDIVQTNEDVMAGLGQEEFFVNGKKTPVKNRVTPVVKDNNILHLLNESLGIRRGSQDKITGAIGRAASAAWLANPITRSIDVATPVFKSLGMLPPSKIPGLIANLRYLGDSIQRAHDTGWIRDDGNTIVGEVLGAGEAFSHGVDKFSKSLSKYTGSEWLENFGRGLSQNLGEYIARTHGALALSGNKRSVDFLDRVSPNWRTLSEAELGTRIGQLFQGKYDATNLPQWLSDSPAAPFFSLARWNIEQWNNFREFAIKPARNGDPVPLISMLVAGIAGGVGIKEIREALSGRKSKIATLKEIAEAPEGSAKYKEAVRYFGNLAQLSGTMGIVSEMSNWGLDIASKDMPAAASMPALEVTRDIIPRLIAAGNAMMDGEDPLTVITQVSRDIGNEHVSAYRFIEGNLGRTGVWRGAGEDLADANARRDLRVGKRLRGEPIKAAVQLPIDYSRAEERAVEKERDPVKMRQMARELKADIKADPDKDNRERRMRSAAASRPSYMPSKENDPKAFKEQLDFVRRTQGPAKAEDLRLRYLRDKKNADVRRKMFN